MSKISDEIIAQIPELYKKYGNQTQVAKELNISRSSVKKYLTLAAAIGTQEPKSTKKKVTKLTEEQIVELNERYANCLNMAQVAREMGISTSTVKKHLTEENLKLQSHTNEDRDALWYYIIRLFGPENDSTPVSAWNLTQMQKFKKQGMPYRGQLLTLKYFYEVKGNSIKRSNRSIGIIPWVYEESRLYYKKIALKQQEISEQIQKQLEQDRIEIKYNPADYIGKQKKKKLIDLNSIGED